MRLLFTLTLFLSSALLFLVQPMIAKMILPRFGGSPGVWNTSMVFFQAMLLLGYAYAHFATRNLGPRVQALTHIVVLCTPLILLPIAVPRGIESAGSSPAMLVLLTLLVAVGAPFFVVSAGAPLLQRWFSATDDPHAEDPYFLYSASNLGSMLALLAYPFVLEPRMSLTDQARLWSLAYGVMAILMAACAIWLWFQRARPNSFHEAPATMPAESIGDASAPEAAGRWERWRWIGLSFCPSSLLLGVTTYLTSNIAPVPLLWVVPLALYLLTFIIAFAKRSPFSSQLLGRFLPLLVIPLAFTIVLEASEPEVMIPLVILHLLVFFIASLMCHRELANHRPRADRLTEFYLYVSVGGVLGGAFNALIAPMLFNSFFEYPLVLAIACAFRPPQTSGLLRWDWIYPALLAVATAAIVFVTKSALPDPTKVRSAIMIGIPLVLAFLAGDRPLRFSASLLAVFVLLSVFQVAAESRIIEAKRSFFGVHRVEQYENSKYGLFRGLLHGNTVHGKENFGPLAGEPLTYYSRTGPIGRVFEVLGPSRKNVALVGLGIGSLAAYGHAGQKLTYFEIDPDVAQIASDPHLFQFVSSCRADLHLQIGDARIELAKSPGDYDLIVLDAFSSDSIPMHLLTREALKLYLSKTAPGGVIAFHISNRYLDLRPVLANEAAGAALRAWVDEDDELDLARGKFRSVWVVMARQESDLQGLTRKYPEWYVLPPEPEKPTWTDDYSNIVSVLKMLQPQD